MVVIVHHTFSDDSDLRTKLESRTTRYRSRYTLLPARLPPRNRRYTFETKFHTVSTIRERVISRCEKSPCLHISSAKSYCELSSEANSCILACIRQRILHSPSASQIIKQVEVPTHQDLIMSAMLRCGMLKNKLPAGLKQASCERFDPNKWGQPPALRFVPTKPSEEEEGEEKQAAVKIAVSDGVTQDFPRV